MGLKQSIMSELGHEGCVVGSCVVGGLRSTWMHGCMEMHGCMQLMQHDASLLRSIDACNAQHVRSHFGLVQFPGALSGMGGGMVF